MGSQMIVRRTPVSTQYRIQHVSHYRRRSSPVNLFSGLKTHHGSLLAGSTAIDNKLGSGRKTRLVRRQH